MLASVDNALDVAEVVPANAEPAVQGVGAVPRLSGRELAESCPGQRGRDRTAVTGSLGLGV